MRGENGTESCMSGEGTPAVAAACLEMPGAEQGFPMPGGNRGTLKAKQKPGHFPAGDKVADHSGRKEPETAESLLNRAALAGKRGNREKSLTLFNAAARLRPADCDLQLDIAQTLKRLGYLAEAADRCRHVLGQERGHTRAAQILARIDAGRVKPDETGDAERPVPSHGLENDKEIKKVRKLRKAGQTVTAESRCREILEASPDRLDASVELALLLRAREAYGEALVQLEAMLIKYPDNLELLLQLAPVLRGLRRYDDARAIFQRILEKQPGNTAALHGAAKLSLRLGEWPEALGTFEALIAVKPDDASVLVDMATAQFEMLRYEDAETTLQRAEALSGTQDDQERYVSRKFQYFCVTGQWDRAQECMAHWPDHRAVPRGALTDVVRFYAERGRWNDVIEFLQERVIDGGVGGPRNGETLLSALASGVRYTGRYAEALAMLDKWPGDDHLAIHDLREQIAEELVLLNAVGLLEPTMPMNASEDITSTVRAERRARMNRALSRSPAAAVQPRDAIYFCADAKYILGAAVSLFSLLRHNPGSARDSDFIVYCPAGMLDFASTIFSVIAAAMRATIEIRSSATLFDENLAFRTKWGSFTLGRGLSVAAYYRIFAAIQLLKERRSRRALYIDADTCVGPGIDALLRFDLDGRPVAVRREDPLGPGVMRASMKLGIPRGEYFNSGVLLFDLSHPGLEAALNHSIDFALNKQHLLTMVDQCALNVAFQNQVTSLPPEFNFFVRDDDSIVIPAQTPVVTHFTAHPKPWDPSYQTRHCLRWCDEFEALGAVLSPGHMKQLFSYSFPQCHGAWQGKQTQGPIPANGGANNIQTSVAQSSVTVAAE
jgi:lipopolysaccharide biosynthesis glycosyltransferase/Flp pilus assembly protein TadD